MAVAVAVGEQGMQRGFSECSVLGSTTGTSGWQLPARPKHLHFGSPGYSDEGFGAHRHAQEASS